MRVSIGWLIGSSLLALALVPACSITALTSEDSRPNDELNPYGDSRGDGSTSYRPGDGGVDAAALPYEGSPLCNASKSHGTCYPDDVPESASCGADAGDAASYACRVRVDSGTAQPICAAAGAGKDGDPCQKGSDCAAGLDCVGTGQCRRYCCDNDCGISSTRPQFCDIQPLADAANMKVPVCIGVKSCELLVAGHCATGETCAVVKPDGTTSCVAVGAAKAGESCDREHCGAGLVCLGAPGKRSCYQLCHTDKSECPVGLKCRAREPLFPDPAVGICEKMP
jgi:hypothetical protein